MNSKHIIQAKNCKQCDKPMLARTNKVFCSASCRAAHHQEKKTSAYETRIAELEAEVASLKSQLQGASNG